MAKPKDRSDHWLMQAMEVLAMAEGMANHYTRSTLLVIADEYLHLSELAEKREKWLKPEAYLQAESLHD